jgi:hypothetical protein
MSLAPRPKLDERADALISDSEDTPHKRVDGPPLSRSSDVVRCLSFSADCAERGRALAAACFFASMCGQWHRVTALVAEGSMDLEQTYNGRTALMIAAEQPAAMPVLQLLVRRGACCSFVGL